MNDNHLFLQSSYQLFIKTGSQKPKKRQETTKRHWISLFQKFCKGQWVMTPALRLARGQTVLPKEVEDPQTTTPQVDPLVALLEDLLRVAQQAILLMVEVLLKDIHQAALVV